MLKYRRRNIRWHNTKKEKFSTTLYLGSIPLRGFCRGSRLTLFLQPVNFSFLRSSCLNPFSFCLSHSLSLSIYLSLFLSLSLPPSLPLSLSLSLALLLFCSLQQAKKKKVKNEGTKSTSTTTRNIPLISVKWWALSCHHRLPFALPLAIFVSQSLYLPTNPFHVFLTSSVMLRRW